MVLGDGLPSGRERAIETLIDMEPQGPFYRAARVLDEVVPQALINRPNLVTKGALVEQANALSEYEINISNYDAFFGSESEKKATAFGSQSSASGTVSSSIDNSSKDLILRHHAKQCNILQQQRNPSKKFQQSKQAASGVSTNTTSSTQLISVLRQFYGNTADESGAYNFRSLLRSVMDHKVFEAQSTAKDTSSTTTEPSAEASAVSNQIDDESGVKSKDTPKIPCTELESLVANLCRLVDDEGQRSTDVVQGLLIAILSVLSQMPTRTNDMENSGNNVNMKGKGRSPREDSSKTDKKAVAEDPVVSPAMQVGSLLYLLKLDDGDNNSKNNNSGGDAAPFQVDQDLLKYFGEAAAAYERRIEIQKARLLAKVNRDAKATPSSEAELRPSEPVSEATPAEDSGESPVTPVALTPTQVDNIDTHFTDQVAILDEDAPLESLAEATLTSSAALEQIISSATGEESCSGAENENADGEEEADVSSESDSNDFEVGGQILEQNANDLSPAGEEEAQEDDDDESSSSSSTSGGDWALMAGRAGGESEIDDDDEEEDVLQQALALSLSEHEAVSRSQTERGPNQGQDIQGREDDQTENSTGTPSGRITHANQPSGDVEEGSGTDGPTYAEVSSVVEAEDADDVSPIPHPPSINLYASLLGQSMEVDAEQSASLDTLLAPYFDPSNFSKFGSIPTPNVLMHLLRFTMKFIEEHKLALSSSCDSQPYQESPTGSKSVALPGGMGLSLFPPSETKTSSNADCHGNSGIAASLQLLIACFLQVMEKRNDAIVGLQKALAKEERHAQGEDLGDDNASTDTDDRSDSTPLSSEEEDDPAIALAMNYAEDEVAESSESLEAKGMIRKAAAAAHDAAELLKLLRRRSSAWKQNVKLYSQCAMSALRSLRQFLQSTVRGRLQELQDSAENTISAYDCDDFIPPLMGSKLSMSLASLMSVSSQQAYVLALRGDETEVKSIFLPSDLYKEAVSTWGECIPLLYPSVSAQVEILRSLISECTVKSTSDPKQRLSWRSFDSVAAMPTSDIEPQIHRLQILCKRLRVVDLLDRVVPRPAHYVAEEKQPDSDVSRTLSGATSNEDASNEPFRASAVVSLVGVATKNVIGGEGELQELFLALCHRFHTRVLLWGCLYERSENDVDDLTGAVAPSVSLTDSVRIGANPSNSLLFDSTKCSDSIAILSSAGESTSGTNGSSVNQRASKVWGTVLSTHHYSPKTGIHRWAVRLDKCERGHVFIGVATSQASMRTYVGGDKYGWGMIGTQALWHDRRKIRGDYGFTFRTGSIIIVTLDTDAGTLSFSSWKDSASSSSFSLDPVLQSQSSARRSTHLNGLVEDWGVAFEGLPLDSRLYPAVGLYQRDDKVTLLPVEARSGNIGGGGKVDLTAGVCFYPSLDSALDTASSSAVSRLRRFNESLSWEGVQYVVQSMGFITEFLEEGEDGVLFATLLPSLSAALCLVPNCIPVLSERFALTLLPHLSRFLMSLEHFRKKGQFANRIFCSGLKAGNWKIRATGPSGENGNFEEYIVGISSCSNENGPLREFEGSGVGVAGKSNNGLVTIFGTVKGSSLHFVEEWSDGDEDNSSSSPGEASSCVVAARMSLDGTKFEGTYRNVQFGTVGQIAGSLIYKPEDAPALLKNSADLAGGVVAGQALLCLAYNHFATVIGEDIAGDQCNAAVMNSAQSDALRKLVSSPLFSCSLLGSSDGSLSRQIGSLKRMYSWNETFDDPYNCRKLGLLDIGYIEGILGPIGETESSSGLHVSGLEEKAAALDNSMAQRSGGLGSLRKLCPEQYDASRERVICALLYACSLEGESLQSEKVHEVWRAALRIMEDGLREAMASANESQPLKQSCIVRCHLLDQISDFLLSFEPPRIPSSTVLEEATILYRTVQKNDDLDFIRMEMEAVSRNALLHLISLRELVKVLSDLLGGGRESVDNSVAVEAFIIGLPRLLDCSQTKSLTRIRKHKLSRRVDEIDEVDGHYSSCPLGCDKTIQLAIQSNAHRLFRIVGGIAKEAVLCRRSGSNESSTSIDSLLLAILSVFSTTLKEQNSETIILQSGIMDVIPKIIGQHRGAVMDIAIEYNVNLSVLKGLRSVCDRDVSRSVLIASTAATHALIFQASQLMNSERQLLGKETDTKSNTIQLCLGFLFKELEHMFEDYEKAATEATVTHTARQADADWEIFCEASCSLKDTEKKETRCQVGSAGLQFLQQHGAAHGSGLLITSPTKPFSRAKADGTSAPKDVSDKVTNPHSIFLNHLVSQWLHILCGALKSPASLNLMSKDSRWLSLLLNAVGLAPVFTSDGIVEGVKLREKDGLMPGRIRARILRFLLLLIENSKPNEQIVKGLLYLASISTCSVSYSPDRDEVLVSREAVTLLRHLHSPKRKAWRECVNKVIFTASSSTFQDESGLALTVGILSFISGTLESIGNGSYVLLKPPAATSLSAEQSSSPSSKNHSGGSGRAGSGIGATSHHIIGNGTESVVAGLGRHDAAAGIVSSIDMKNGMCEVILLTRGIFISDAVHGSSPISQYPSRGFHGYCAQQNSLTIRALRTALSDVVRAQEAPLLLDDTMSLDRLFGPLIESGLSTLSLAMKPGAGLPLAESESGTEDNENMQTKKAGLTELSSALMLLRSIIVLLSDKRIASAFSKSESSKRVLSYFLRLAWPADSEEQPISECVAKYQKQYLSSLPVHEARYGHLVSLFQDLYSRKRALKKLSEEQWAKRLDDLQYRRTAMVKSSDVITGSGETTDTASGNLPSADVGAGANVDANARNAELTTNRAVSQSTMSSNSEDEEESEVAATAAAHLREAAIAQMAELGLPRSWSELALRRTGGNDIEAAVHFCLERGGDMERLLAEERERERMMQRQPGSGSSRRRAYRAETGSSSDHLLRQLLEMGFPNRWCTEALAATGNNVDEALTWILTHGERLSEEDEAIDDEDDGEDIDEEEDESLEEEEDIDRESAGKSETDDRSGDVNELEQNAAVWSGSVVPLRFISGRSLIDPKTLAVSGLPTGGFSSVGTKGVLLCSGKWYYEATLETAGCLQIGWADGSFAGHCHADRGDGTGDGPSSWAFDGWRRYRWHSTATEWGCRWKEGDVVGCLVDMDEMTVSYTLNGRGEEIGMGVAFSGEGFRPCGGVYACVSFNRREKLRLRLNEPFQHPPPSEYQGVGVAVLDAVREREALAAKEDILDPNPGLRSHGPNRFLCDFSDGEHGHELMAWAHRYYGSDASVHLGSGRPKQTQGIPKGSVSPLPNTPRAYVSRRVKKIWAATDGISTIPGKDDQKLASTNEVMSRIHEGYTRVAKQLSEELLSESIAMTILFARKLILHFAITMGSDFDLACLLEGKDAVWVARQFWKTIDLCASLRCAGWVGEAGAMAIAAEALGLGISSNDHGHPRHAMTRPGVVSVGDLDDGMLLPTGGISQLLSSVLRSTATLDTRDTGDTLAACAEASIGSDGGGGVLLFLQMALQSAIYRSKELRNVIVAAVRRSVRLLAVVEYEGDDTDTSDQIQDDNEVDRGSSELLGKRDRDDNNEDPDVSSLPDARLTSFLTGLIMSKPVETSVSEEDYSNMLVELFEAWSVGLLSASLPWRMVCAFTVAGILNKCPTALLHTVSAFPTLARFYGRLESSVARRVWAERAAVPVCSRYVQAMLELLAAVKESVSKLAMPQEFEKYWGKISVDAATPLPLQILLERRNSFESNWECDEGWVSTDASWEVWTGTVEYMAVDWETPSRSPVRSLMDGGEGPPMLREGCFVMRGPDWTYEGSGATEGDEDGKESYEAEKANRDKEKRRPEEETQRDTDNGGEVEDNVGAENEPVSGVEERKHEDQKVHSSEEIPDDGGKGPDQMSEKQKKKRIPSPKLPVGTVLSVEPWNGIPGQARRVRWHRTGKEGLFRYGGDGGRYDISHVEINDKHTRVKKRQPVPESAEQCAARHGFGANKKFNVILRLQRYGIKKRTDGSEEEERSGILEWPDFGAGIAVNCVMHADGAVTLTENRVLFGSKDAGWEARFGQPSFVAGTSLVLSPIESTSKDDEVEPSSSLPYQSSYEELFGSASFQVVALRNRKNGERVRVTSEMRLFRPRQRQPVAPTPNLDIIESAMPPPIRFDSEYHASSLSLSRDGRTVSCVSSDGRGAAFGSVGFTKGVHYWEVKLEQADIGSVFIGVAEKPNSPGSGGSFDSSPRLNRWPGWGFVNFRATYSAGAERVYGAHCHAGDTVGVMLDCDAGRISFFFDGLKYGEHILNDLGCAFENISPFGFNVDGCGSGGAGQGAPSGTEGGRGGRYPAQGSVRPRALWPVIGLRNQGDRVTISPKWITSYGVDGVATTRNVLAVNEILSKYSEDDAISPHSKQILPDWFINEAFTEYRRWQSGRWKRAVTRGSGPYRQTSFGLDADLDASHLACATASAALGLKHALLAGDRVRLVRSAGRILELAEEAIVLGAYQGRLFYAIVSQKSEGGSLTEGGGRAWCWDESEVVDGLPLVGKGQAEDIELPMMDKFMCKSSGGLKVAYDGGAVVRSDLEIIDGSINLGVIPVNTVIEKKNVLERRINSCGVTRYRVRAKLGDEEKEGWISARIRGGKEESIVEPVEAEIVENIESQKREGPKSFSSALECALVWKEEYDRMIGAKVQMTADEDHPFFIGDLETFKSLTAQGLFGGLSAIESDSLLVATITAISDFSDSGDAVDSNFKEIASALGFAIGVKKDVMSVDAADFFNPAAYQAAASILSHLNSDMPPLKAIMARVALIRAFNRRARLALPWMSVRPCQEGSAILGGLCGHGASSERSGRNLLLQSQELWVQVPSIASRARVARSLFFGGVKKGLLQSITEVTATPTPLSHDEYELPREIRTVRLNRLRARIAMGGKDNNAKRKYSVFAQLHNETKGWGGAALRRGYIAKGHGGQKRAFKVKLIGEGVNDYSGPYREAFTDAITEVLDVDAAGAGSLGVLDPTPNNSSDVGENRSLYMFSLNGQKLSAVEQYPDRDVSEDERRIWQSFSSLTAPRDEPSREVEEHLVFLGRITGTAYRHGIPLDLPLPLHSVWRTITNDDSKDEERLREIDELAYRQSSSDASFSPLLRWQQRMLNSFVEGLSNVLPVEVLKLLSGEELREVVCGNADVDVDLLRSVVEYEGYSEIDEVIQYFWETLRGFTNAERKLFLQFVWARNRLPLKKSDFEAPFKIQRDSKNDKDNADKALPSASTCFFSLALPEYSSQSILREKLLFAITNVTTMETDFQTNSAEIAEGYRAF